MNHIYKGSSWQDEIWGEQDDKITCMAVKTRFTEKEFMEILSGYNLGEYQGSKAISSGTVQTNFFLLTTKGKLVFRYYENRSRESVMFECNLIKYLKDRKYPCPAIYKDKKGKYVGTYQGKPFAIFEFIEGHHLKNPSEAQKKQLIEKVAELQNLTKNYRPRYKAYRWNYDVGLCGELAQKAAREINTANAREKLEWHKHELMNLSLPKSLPKGICHCDFDFSNILFKDGNFAALIDFDDANYTFLTYDLITLMDPFISSFNWKTWSQFRKDEDVFDFREARKVVEEYRKYRPLSILEQRHLFDVYKLSILFDCLWRFDRGEVSDFYERRKIDQLNRLGREKFSEELLISY